jgi:hypothetical protein
VQYISYRTRIGTIRVFMRQRHNDEPLGCRQNVDEVGSELSGAPENSDAALHKSK